MNRILLCSALASSLVIATAHEAEAQSPLSQVLDLNRQAMDAYQMLELEQAQEKLERALQIAQQRNVTGAPLARTYLNLGVVAVGGFADNGRGMQYFRQALGADPNISLDPLTSTPEIQTVFNLARQQGGTGGGGGGGGGAGGGGGGGGGGGAGGGGGGGAGAGGNLPHTAVPEQLAQTAVPVYIEVEGRPAHVYLFYKGHGMREFRRVEMQSVAGGYGYEIPCSDIYQPAVQYYIVAFGGDGSPLGFAGTQSSPISVPIVGSRTQPAPALPGRAPPQTCTESECPPGMEGCASGGGGGSMGSTCRLDGDCGSGLVCRDDLCITGERGGGGGGGGGGDDIPHFFFRASLGGAFGYVQSGMAADDVRPGECRPDEFGDCQGDVREAAPHDPAAWEMCPAGLCVRVGQPGFVPNFQVRLAAGYYIHGFEYLGVAAFVRIAPFSGYGDLAGVVVGGRLQLRPLVDLERQGGSIIPILTIFAGFSGGQVQHQPPSNGQPGDAVPWVISGLNGLPIGVSGGVRFGKHIGAYAEAELMFQFPTFMFNLDLSAGLEVGF